MWPNRILNIVVCFSIVLIVQNGIAQQHEPDLTWLTLKSQHFSVHFPEGYRELAQTITDICEEVYEPVSKSLHYHPHRTHVVIHTRSDISNGLVGPLPWRMELYVTEPQENWIGSRDKWLKVLITHEFTHIVHLRKNKGLSAITYPFFGEFNLFWQIITPHWFVEGFPTLNETQFTHGGRGRNPYHWMQMMAPIQAGQPWSLENTNYISRKRLPIGMFYVSGYYLTNYISKNYGSETWAKILDRYAAFPILGFSCAVKSITGKSQKQLYRKMLDEFEANIPPEKPSHKTIQLWPDSISYSAVMASPREKVPENYYSPRWIDKNHIMAYRTTFDELPALIKMDRNGGVEEIVHRRLTNHDNSFSVGERFMVWTELKPHIRFSATNYADIKLFDFEKETIETLTQGARVYSLDLSPDEKQIVAVQTDLPTNRLVLINVASGKIEPLLHIPNASLLNPRWSPDGQQIAFAVKDSSGRQDIAGLQIETGEWHYLYQPDDYHENNPCWSPDGKFVFYTSDRSGIFNIWAVHVQNGSRWQVTDTVLGVFAPNISPLGDELVFSVYTYSGFSTATMRIDRNDWRKKSSKERYEVSESLKPIDKDSQSAISNQRSVTSISSYQHWGQMLRPQGWIPMVFEMEGNYAPGVVGISQDVLHRHLWQGTIGYSLETDRPLYDLSYFYQRWWPQFGFKVYNVAEKVSFRQHTGWWRKKGVEITASVPLLLETNVYTSFLQPYFSIKHETRERSTGILYPRYKTYRGWKVGFSMFRGSQTLRDVVPHRAWRIETFYEGSAPVFGSEFTAHQLQARANMYYPTLIKHHQLQFRFLYQARRGNYGYGYAGALPIGYDDDGRMQQFKLKIGYHFPLAFVEWAVPILPVYLDYLGGSFFYDWGTSWNHGLGNSRWRERGRYSVGAQLYIRAMVFQIVSLRIGAALFYRSDYQDWQISPVLSVPFF